MDVLLFILVVTILLLILNIKNSVTTRLNSLQQKIDALTKELGQSAETRNLTIAAKKKGIVESEIFPEAVPATKSPGQEKTPDQEIEEIKPPGATVSFPEVNTPSVVEEKVQPTVPKKPGFFERNPDLEKFIGENLANKIGIGILVLGIGFFVKYAIDQNWINEIGRVCIGLACGGALIGVAHWMRKSFIAFSSVLVGGGIAVLYLTIAIAFHEYGIFSQSAAFILMLLITSFSVTLSLAYNRKELAILAILGGFASPFMISTGEGNYIVLFVYILILDCGMLALAYFKKWNPVNIICYAFTLLLFGSWLAARFDGTQLSMIVGAIVFATLFYLVFFAMNLVNNIKERRIFKAIEISMLLSNTFFYYAAGMVILNNDDGENFKGLFTAVLGVFNFIFAYSLFKSDRVDRNLVFLLIGLVLTFISLAAPVQLEGNYITLFWAAESVLLLWLSQKSGIRLMKLASVVVTALMVISLVMDWQQVYLSYNDTILQIMLNKGYVTSWVAIAAVVGVIYLLRNERTEKPEYIKLFKNGLIVVGVAILYISQLLELQYQISSFELAYSAQRIIVGCYNVIFLLGLLLAQPMLGTYDEVKKAFPFIGFLGIIIYLFFYHFQVITARNEYLFGEATVTGFVFHYVLVAALIAVSILSIRKMQELTNFNNRTFNLYSWIYVFFFVFITSAELDHTVLLASYTPEKSIGEILTQIHKIGYPILWGISSFVIIAIGLQTKKKHLRIISLTLFLVTLLKLFLVDIRGISEGGKIAAFISLGVLLLVVSFMYQRLKKLLLTDEVTIKKKDKE